MRHVSGNWGVFDFGAVGGQAQASHGQAQSAQVSLLISL